ncbi:MAG TPA: threonine synthase [Gaiellaceae bacterium]|nr:threonine synthase [Gaiellaceae bacterium]
MSAYSLRCRVCEEETVATPIDTCRRCDGPTDVAYDWDRVRSNVTPASIADGPPSLWRYRQLLPGGARLDYGAGWTPLVRAERLSQLLGIDLRLKLETSNPTFSFKDRLATVAAQVALDYGVTTLCCSSTGNLGDAVAAASAAAGIEAIVLAPVGEASIGAIARAAGAKVFAVRGGYDDCRRLQLMLGELFPWGFVDGNLHPYAAEGAKTIAFEIAEQLGWSMPDAVVCPTGTGNLFSKLAQGFSEAVAARLTSGVRPRMFGAQPAGASPIATAYADDRGIARVRPETDVWSLAVGDPAFGELAIGAARSTDGAIFSVPEADVTRHTELLTSTTGVFADCAGGVALAGLVEAVSTGAIRPGARVVLVVTGAGVKPHGRLAQPQDVEIEPDLDALLRHLGVEG